VISGLSRLKSGVLGELRSSWRHGCRLHQASHVGADRVKAGEDAEKQHEMAGRMCRRIYSAALLAMMR
jgi:hypothetical protein